MPTLEELQAIATKKEQAAARRLVKRGSWSEEAAIIDVLRRSAGSAGIAALISDRHLMQAKAAAAADARRQRNALKLIRRMPEAPDRGDLWLGWFDGSAHPNPGEIGLGGLIEGPSGASYEICLRAGTGDSSEAEYLALIAVLEKALSCAVSRLRICGDSQTVINDVNRGLKQPESAGARGLEHHCATVRALLHQFEHVELHWVPRHKNAAADRLSQLALASA